MLLQQTLPPEKIITAWNEMLQFLQNFIENNLQLSGLRYVVRDHTYIETLLGNSLRRPGSTSSAASHYPIVQ